MAKLQRISSTAFAGPAQVNLATLHKDAIRLGYRTLKVPPTNAFTTQDYAEANALPHTEAKEALIRLSEARKVERLGDFRINGLKKVFYLSKC